MALILDDLADFTGTFVVGQPWTQLFRKIYDTARQEMYDLSKVNNRIKTNRMLYEYGEIPREEYEKINAKLMEERKIAMKIRGMEVGFE